MTQRINPAFWSRATPQFSQATDTLASVASVRPNVGGYCWGFVAGKSNTIFAWKTWQEPEPNPEPKVWFHDIFRTDGTPFDAKEVEYIQKITGAKK